MWSFLEMLCEWFMVVGVATVLAGPPTTCSSESCDLETLTSRVDNSWLQQLAGDPDQSWNQPNKRPRQVFSGHYVNVRPTPLPNPQPVICSMEVFELLGLSAEECESNLFVKAFSGDVTDLPAFQSSWATPYALSIYGQEKYDNCPFKTGNGYGDGRAISLAEVISNGSRWELQLKGSGTTPWCRGGDGRAVLRSSIREFLASEAMYHLGVPTTRALSLIVSGTETVSRPWYSDNDRKADEKHGGDIHRLERCAMTTRVAPSFLRVGHFELFGRRARKGVPKGKEQLEMLARHALFREYPHLLHAKPTLTFQQQLLKMIEEAAERFASLAAHWVRVGYTQSNFNSDNCLVGGSTVDYGPFGFIERYDPGWGMWIGSGDHFAFMNQPAAAGKNFAMFARSLLPLLDDDGKGTANAIVSGFDTRATKAVQNMFCKKLGIQHCNAEAIELSQDLFKLLEAIETVDYTIFWRQLSDLPGHDANAAPEQLIKTLLPAFYDDLPTSVHFEWGMWISKWLQLLGREGRSAFLVNSLMKQASPKYVPREWMLVEAYTAAENGNYTPVRVLHDIFKKPYDEQPLYESLYYRQAPEGSDAKGGVGFMS